jgi:hypothetical protein
LSFLGDPLAKSSVGISHDSEVQWKTATVNGKPVRSIQKILRPFGVDFVPSGNAGGRVHEAEGAEDEERDTMDQEQIAALASAVAEAVGTKFQEAIKPLMPADPARATEAEPTTDRTATLEAEVAQLRAANTARTQRDLVQEAVASESNLTDSQRTRIVETLCATSLDLDGIGTRISEACEREREYGLKILSESGLRTRVNGNGSAASTRTQESTEDYEKRFQGYCDANGLRA